MMTVYRGKTRFMRSGRIAGSVHQSLEKGPNRSEQRLEGASFEGRPELPASLGAGNPVPVWLSALIASSCHAFVNGTCRAIEWSCQAGRAIYTNRGRERELIEPLGIHLDRGDTLAVSWMPGKTEYTFEIQRAANCRA